MEGMIMSDDNNLPKSLTSAMADYCSTPHVGALVRVEKPTTPMEQELEGRTFEVTAIGETVDSKHAACRDQWGTWHINVSALRVVAPGPNPIFPVIDTE